MREGMARLGRAGFVLLFFVPFLLSQIFGWNLSFDGPNLWWINLTLSPVWTGFGLLILVFVAMIASVLIEWIWVGGSDNFPGNCY